LQKTLVKMNGRHVDPLVDHQLDSPGCCPDRLRAKQPPFDVKTSDSFLFVQAFLQMSKIHRQPAIPEFQKIVGNGSPAANQMFLPMILQILNAIWAHSARN